MVDFLLQSKLTFKPFNQYEKKRSQKYKRQTTKNNEIKAEKCNENHYRRAWFVIWSWQLALHIYFLQLVIFSVQENGFSKFHGFSILNKKRKKKCRKGDKMEPVWNFFSENSRCSSAMPNHHPINTFMESSSWKVLPTTGKFLLTHIPMVLLSHFLSPEMEKRKTV